MELRAPVSRKYQLIDIQSSCHLSIIVLFYLVHYIRLLMKVYIISANSQSGGLKSCLRGLTN